MIHLKDQECFSFKLQFIFIIRFHLNKILVAPPIKRVQVCLLSLQFPELQIKGDLCNICSLLFSFFFVFSFMIWKRKWKWCKDKLCITSWRCPAMERPEGMTQVSFNFHPVLTTCLLQPPSAGEERTRAIYERLHSLLVANFCDFRKNHCSVAFLWSDSLCVNLTGYTNFSSHRSWSCVLLQNGCFIWLGDISYSFFHAVLASLLSFSFCLSAEESFSRSVFL